MSVEISFVGHSCFEITTGDTRILVDPFLKPNNPAATRSAADFAPDVVVLTHGHVDHVADAVGVATAANAELIAIVEVANWCAGQGVERVVDPNLGGTVTREWGSVKLMPALHTNTLPDGTVVGTPAGLLFTLEGKRIYHLGDTALFSDLALARRTAPVDVAIVPIGGHYTMDPEDAAEAVRLIEPAQVIPCHYNTFPPIEQDAGEFARLVGAVCSSETVVLEPDESLKLG
jgi:L-ascorbate metabolism protein UlaG (beta-lactamase superfamily)